MKKHSYIFWLLISWLALQSFFLFVDGWFTVYINNAIGKPGNLRAGFTGRPIKKTYRLGVSSMEITYRADNNFAAAVAVINKKNYNESLKKLNVPESFSLAQNSTGVIKGFAGKVDEQIYFATGGNLILRIKILRCDKEIYFISTINKNDAEPNKLADKFYSNLFFRI
jgi:hypothetical protein